MSSNRKKTRDSNKKVDIEQKNKNRAEEDYDEADRLLEELDKMEQERENVSSRARKLIRGDKEAIRKMNEEMAKLQEDELDYLDDEKEDDYLPGAEVDNAREVVVKSNDISKKTDTRKRRKQAKETVKSPDEEKIQSEAKNRNEAKNQSEAKRRSGAKQQDSDKIKDQYEEEYHGHSQEREKSNVVDVSKKVGKRKGNMAVGSEETGQQESQGKKETNEPSEIRQKHQEDKTDKENNENTENERDEVKLDFFESLEREYPKPVSIRKKQPKKPESSKSQNFILTLYHESKKYFFVGAAVSILLIALFVALVVDGRSKGKNSGVSGDASTTEFLEIDTQPMIELVEGYYEYLYKEDYDAVRECLSDGENISDQEIFSQSRQIQLYYELASDFSVTDCYIQQGLHENEYIAYMKFKLRIKSVETPAVGIFTCYLLASDVNDAAGSDMNTGTGVNQIVQYKLYMNLNDKNTGIYKYINKMKNSSAVKKLFADTDAELELACKNDENLNEIVEALKNNNVIIPKQDKSE